MAGNLPDGCIWPSDLDYYEAMNPTPKEDRDDFDWTDEDAEPRHPSGCICADCSDAELTAEND